MTKFNPSEHLIDLRGKKYLPVNMRLVWFREDHPKGSIQTEVMNYDPIVMQARVYSGDGVLLATGHGTANSNGKQAVWTGREIEKAETAAIGRALGHAGFGTQFDNDDDDLDNLADSPLEVVRSEKTAADKVLGNGHDRPRNLVQNAVDPLPASNSGNLVASQPFIYSRVELFAQAAMVQPLKGITTQERNNTIIKMEGEGAFKDTQDYQQCVELVIKRVNSPEHGNGKKAVSA